MLFIYLFIAFYVYLTAPALINGPKGGVVLDFSRDQGSTPPHPSKNKQINKAIPVLALK